MPTNEPGMATVIRLPVKYVRSVPEIRMAERRPRPPRTLPPQPKPVTAWRVMKYVLASTLLAVVMVVMLALSVTDPLEGGGDSQTEAEVGGPPHPFSLGGDTSDKAGPAWLSTSGG